MAFLGGVVVDGMMVVDNLCRLVWDRVGLCLGWMVVWGPCLGDGWLFVCVWGWLCCL